MRYSEIIGQSFYLIELPKENLCLVDAHYLASAHHFHRMQHAHTPALKEFHREILSKHFHALMQIISSGDFSKANDPSGKGFDDPRRWRDAHFKNPESWPDSEMFSSMSSDRRYLEGESYPYDVLLKDPSQYTRLTHLLLMDSG